LEVLALIPARSGSKGIPHKNIAMFHGKPLLAHSVIQAKAARTITRVIVSTDSPVYAAIARQFGAETPFDRPAEISGDFANDLEVFEHALIWLDKNEGYRPDICVHLRPTYPTRRVEDIDRAVELLASDPSYDSVRSVVKAPETPFKMWFMDGQGRLDPVVSPREGLVEPYNMPRQALPQAYLQNASVDVAWARVIREQHSMTGKRIRGMEMAHLHDIDDAGQLAEAGLAAAPELRGRKFVFDMDGVIATITPDNDYRLAEPIRPTIELINRLHDLGNRIVIATARGSETGIDWTDVTRGQLERWGVKYDKLMFGKPAGDYYVDDRFVSLTDLKKMLDRMQ
jgi:CMP-N,N'-diacetyllegionaminic acid synthase